MQHRTHLVISVLVCLGGLVSPGCQDRSAPAGSELGKIDFSTSGSLEAQEHFIQGALRRQRPATPTGPMKKKVKALKEKLGDTLSAPSHEYDDVCGERDGVESAKRP